MPTSAASIVPKAVSWLWDQRIPSGQLTLFAGREGTGKSSACIWTAAHLTRGTLPGAMQGSPQHVLIVATEDAYDTTIVPRLMAANADLARVTFIEIEEEGGVPDYLTFPQDLDLLADACAATGATYVIIDPLSETLDIKLDTYKEREVRQGLRPLITFAIQRGVTLAGIMHFNKAQGDPLNMISGSGGFKNIARSILAFAKDTRKPDGERVMQQIKSSLGPDSVTPWLYSIEEVALPGREITTSRFTLMGDHGSRSVQDIMQDNQRADSGDSGEPEAAQWLRLHMMTQPDWKAPMSTVVAAGVKEGFTDSQIKRAKEKVRGYTIQSERQSLDSSGAGSWFWCMQEVES